MGRRVLALGIALLAAGSARAELVTYTETVTGSGTFAGKDFTNALITITGTADTANITNPSAGIFQVVDSATTVTVAGLGTAKFNDSILVDSTQTQGSSTPAAGFGDATQATALLYTRNAAFTTYDLRSSLGITSGDPSLNSGTTFSTTLGDFSINSTTGLASFSATVDAVPEPSSLLMAGMGMALMLSAKRTRSRLRSRSARAPGASPG